MLSTGCWVLLAGYQMLGAACCALINGWCGAEACVWSPGSATGQQGFHLPSHSSSRPHSRLFAPVVVSLRCVSCPNIATHLAAVLLFSSIPLLADRRVSCYYIQSALAAWMRLLATQLTQPVSSCAFTISSSAVTISTSAMVHRSSFVSGIFTINSCVHACVDQPY